MLNINNTYVSYMHFHTDLIFVFNVVSYKCNDFFKVNMQKMSIIYETIIIIYKIMYA